MGAATTQTDRIHKIDVHWIKQEKIIKLNPRFSKAAAQTILETLYSIDRPIAQFIKLNN